MAPRQESYLENMEKIRVEETRREFLVRSAQGLGTLALASLLGQNRLISGAEPSVDSVWRGALDAPHFVPRAKRIIYLYQAGGPSHADILD